MAGPTPVCGSSRGRSGRTPRVRRRSDEGVTLVEVLVASVVLLVTMIPMGMLLTSASSAAVNTRQRQAALQLADSWVEILSNSQPPTHNDGSVITNSPRTPVAPAGTQTPPSTLAGTTYTVTANYVESFVNGVGQSDFCSAGQPPSPSHPGVIGLKVVVAWGGSTRRSLSVTTDINYPKPGLQTEGFLAVNLTNDGEADVLGNTSTDRLQSIPVTITQISGSPVLNPSSFTVHADGNGCIFAQVPVGTYTVAAQQPTSGTPATFTGYSGTPPFVSTSGATSELVTNQTVTVTAETTVQLDAFDEGIIGRTSYGGASAVDAGVQCPAVSILTCVTTGSGPTGAVAAWGGGGAGWTTASLAAGTPRQPGGMYHRGHPDLRRRGLRLQRRRHRRGAVHLLRSHVRRRPRRGHRPHPGGLPVGPGLLRTRHDGCRPGPPGRLRQTTAEATCGAWSPRRR